MFNKNPKTGLFLTGLIILVFCFATPAYGAGFDTYFNPFVSVFSSVKDRVVDAGRNVKDGFSSLFANPVIVELPKDDLLALSSVDFENSWREYITPNNNITPKSESKVVITTTPAKKTPTPVTISNADIVNALRKLIIEDGLPSDVKNRFVGPVGAQGPVGPIGPQGPAGSSGGYSSAPYSIIPANPSQDFSGATILSATELSSTNFETKTAKAQTLNVTGNTSFYTLDVSSNIDVGGLLSFSGTDTAGLKLNNLTTAQRDALTPSSGLALFNTTTSKMQVYDGSAWKNVGNPEIGGEVTGGTSGSVLFVDSSGYLAQDNTNFFWDNTNNRLGIGTTNPSTLLDINGVTTFRGNIIAGTDNTYDIGASGATRPRTGYFGTSVITPALTVSGLTSGRVPFTTTGGAFIDDADLTFATDTLSATKLLSSTSISTPSLISTGAITTTPLAGSNFNVVLATTGDFVVNTNQLLVDTSSGNVGIGTISPLSRLSVVGGGTGIESVVLAKSATSLIQSQKGFNGYTNFSGGLSTGGLDSLSPMQRITSEGNLINIGKIQAGEINLTSGGILATKVDYTSGTGPRGVGLGDLNGDGYLDLIVANNDSASISVLMNDGDGTFASKVDYAATGKSPSDIAVGDVNGDGYVDVAVAGYSSLIIFINDGDGTLASGVNYASGDLSGSVTLADFNSDGVLDAATSNYFDNDFSVYINNGDGTFVDKVDYQLDGRPDEIESADVNGDGKMDLITAVYVTNEVSVSINNGDGTFATKVDYLVYDPYALTVADFNGDGKADIAAGSISGIRALSVLINNGDGTFATKVDYTNGLDIYSLASGDINGDGYNDVISANASGTSVSVYLNDGDGTFATKVDYATASNGPMSVAMGDINNDGKLDVVEGGSSGTSVSVLLNTASSMFVVKVSSGNVGIGITNPTYKLQVNGQPAANGYTSFTNYSDFRLKENVEDLFSSDELVLSKIAQLRPVTYNYNELTGYDEAARSRRISGFIAQELQEVFPNMVGTTTINGVEYFDTNLSDLPLYLVGAIQELNLNIESIAGTNKLSTLASESFVSNFFDNLFNKISIWLADASNGVAKLFAREIRTEKLCVGTVCITENQFQDLLTGSGIEGSMPSANEDLNPPTITLNGNTNISLVVGEEYIEQGAEAGDDVDESVSVIITGVVDVETDGTYTIRYNATDSSGNQATEVTRTVVVGDGGSSPEPDPEEISEEEPAPADSTPPSILLNGASEINIDQGSVYTEQGAIVTDNVTQDMIATIGGSVDTTTVGTYILTYNATDEAGNAATEVTRTVNVVEVVPPEEVPEA